MRPVEAGFQLRRLARRHRRLIAAQVFLRALLLVALTTASAFAAPASGLTAPTAGFLLVVGSGVLAWVAVAPQLVAWGPSSDLVFQARLAEARVPDLQGRLLTLAERLDGPRDGESAALLSLVERRSAPAMRKLRPSRIHPIWPVLRAAVSAPFGLAVLAVAALIWPWAEVRAFWTAGADLDTEAPPEWALLGDITLAYDYPDYTGLPTLVVENTTGDVHAVPGTRVGITARSAVPLQAVASVVGDGVPVVGELLDPRSVRVELVVPSTPTTWAFEIAHGGTVARSRPMKVEPEPDVPPTVTLVGASLLRVAPDETIPLMWRAVDDYGLASIALLVGEALPGFPLRALDPALPSATGMLRVTPADLGLDVGQVVILTVIAWDADAVSGPKVGRSSSIVLRVGDRAASASLDELVAIRDLWVDLLAHTLADPPTLPAEAGAWGRWKAAVVERYEPSDALLATLPAAAGSLHLRAEHTDGDGARFVAAVSMRTAPPRPSDADTLTVLQQAALEEIELSVLVVDSEIQSRALRRAAAQAELGMIHAYDVLYAVEHDDGDLLPLDRFDASYAVLADTLTLLASGGLRDHLDLLVPHAAAEGVRTRELVVQGEPEAALIHAQRLVRLARDVHAVIQDALDGDEARREELVELLADLDRALARLEPAQRLLLGETMAVEARASPGLDAAWSRVDAAFDALVVLGPPPASVTSWNTTEFLEEMREQRGHLGEAIHARDRAGTRRSARPVESVLGRWTKDEYGPPPDLAKLRTALIQLDEAAEGPVTADLAGQAGPQAGLRGDLAGAIDLAGRIELLAPFPFDTVTEPLTQAVEPMAQAEAALREGRLEAARDSQQAAADLIATARAALRDFARRCDACSGGSCSGGSCAGGNRVGEDDGGHGGSRRPGRGVLLLVGPEDFITPEAYRQALIEGSDDPVPPGYEAAKLAYYEELARD